VGTAYFLQHPWWGMLSNLPVLVGAAAMLLAANGAFRERYERRPVLWFGLTYGLTRIAFLILVVRLFGHVSSDLSGYFLTQARAAAEGLVPYRDFHSSYGPLFPCLLAAATRLLQGPAGIFALFLAADLGVAFLLVRSGGVPAVGGITRPPSLRGAVSAWTEPLSGSPLRWSGSSWSVTARTRC